MGFPCAACTFQIHFHKVGATFIYFSMAIIKLILPVFVKPIFGRGWLLRHVYWKASSGSRWSRVGGNSHSSVSDDEEFDCPWWPQLVDPRVPVLFLSALCSALITTILTLRGSSSMTVVKSDNGFRRLSTSQLVTTLDIARKSREALISLGVDDHWDDRLLKERCNWVYEELPLDLRMIFELVLKDLRNVFRMVKYRGK